MLLGFKQRFVDPIQLGTKVHTLRSFRKHEPKLGETLHMYTGLRTNKCELISNREKLISRQVADIYISFKLKPFSIFKVSIKVDGKMLDLTWLKIFARFDGFLNIEDFANFWIEGVRKEIIKSGRQNKIFMLRSTKNLIHWTALRY